MRLPDGRSEHESYRVRTYPSLFDLGIYVRRYRLIAGTVLVAILMGVAIAALKPSYYTAKVTLLVGNRLGQGGVVAAEGERRAFALKMQQLAAQRARLQAESAEADGIAFPPELSESAADPVVRSMLQGQQQLFAARRRALEESVERIRHERALAEQRVASLGRQVGLAAIQQESIDKEVADLRSLVERKLAPAPRLSDLQRTAATIASHKVEIESEIARTEQGKNQAEQRMAEVRNQRRSEVLAELQKVEAEFRELGSRRDTLRAVAATTLSDQKFDQGLLANQADLITSDDLVRAVALRLKLHQDPRFTGPLGPETDPESQLRAAARVLQTNLSAARIAPGSRLDVAYRGTEAQQASLIANTVAEVFVERQRNTPADLSDGHLAGELAAQQPGATILRAAELPRRPDGPGPLSICAAAAVVGLLGGIMLAAGTELLGSVPTLTRDIRDPGPREGDANRERSFELPVRRMASPSPAP